MDQLSAEPTATPVTETTDPSLDGVVVHPGWAEQWPWLIQGTTCRAGDVGGDYRMFGDAPSGEILGRWASLLESVGMPAAVHAHQVHGAEVLVQGSADPGLRIVHGVDGHVTHATGLLLTVSLADCVPIFLVDPVNRAVGLLHAGWRGVSEGILWEGLSAMGEAYGSHMGDTWVHLGPAICGECYEVGPEVHEALGLAAPDGPCPVDLRAVLAKQALGAGIPADSLTTSLHCARCGPGKFHSHRGGSRGRHIGMLGIRTGL